MLKCKGHDYAISLVKISNCQYFQFPDGQSPCLFQSLYSFEPDLPSFSRPSTRVLRLRLLLTPCGAHTRYKSPSSTLLPFPTNNNSQINTPSLLMSSQDVSKPPSPLSQTPTGAATAIPELGDIIRENQLIPIGTTYFSPTITIRPDSPEHASLRSLVDRLSESQSICYLTGQHTHSQKGSQTGDSELDTGRSNRAALPSSKGDHEEQSTMPSAQQFQTDSSNGESQLPSTWAPLY